LGISSTRHREELHLGTLRVLDVPALRATIPVTLVNRRKGI
jgi:hypothetical protein